MVKIFDKRQMQNKANIGYWGIFFIIFILLVGVDISGYKKIANIGEKTYSVETYSDVEQRVKNDVLEGRFQSVGSETNALGIRVAEGNIPVGVLAYEIYDEENTLVYEKKEDNILNYATDGVIKLPVSEGNLQQGKAYALKVAFHLENEMGIVTNSDTGLSLIQYYKFDYQRLLYGILILFNILFCIIVGICFKYGLKDRIFLTLFCIMAISAAIFMPPANRDDEYRHFIRAYDLANQEKIGSKENREDTYAGNVMADEDNKVTVATVPKEIDTLRLLAYDTNYDNASYQAELNFTTNLSRIHLLLMEEESNSKDVVSEEATYNKGMISYMPQIVGIKIGELFGVRSFYVYYMARMGQVLICALLLLLALKIAPAYKVLIWFLALIPNTILLVGSCNPDGWMIVLLILYMSIVLALRKYKVEIFSKQAIPYIVGLLIIGYVVGKMKIPYLAMCIGMLLFLRKDNFKREIGYLAEHKNAKYGVIAGCVVGLLLLIVLGWKTGIIKNVMMGFVSKEHFDYILEHPGMIINLFAHKFVEQMIQLYQAVSGYMRISYPIVGIICLVLCEKTFRILEKIWSGVLFLGMAGVVLLVGYIMTPPDYGTIVGISYRYFLPIIPLAAMLMPSGNEKTQKMVERYYPIFLVGNVCVACMEWCLMFWLAS